MPTATAFPISLDRTSASYPAAQQLVGIYDPTYAAALPLPRQKQLVAQLDHYFFLEN
jgi:hypothetical protein